MLAHSCGEEVFYVGKETTGQRGGREEVDLEVGGGDLTSQGLERAVDEGSLLGEGEVEELGKGRGKRDQEVPFFKVKPDASPIIMSLPC